MSSAPASYGEERLRCARYMEQDLAAPPSGRLLTETCLSALPLPGHDLLDRAVSPETRMVRPETRLSVQIEWDRGKVQAVQLGCQSHLLVLIEMHEHE